jgi:hypothetical protein
MVRIKLLEDLMSRLLQVIFCFVLSFSAWGSDLSLKGFEERFKLVKNEQNKITSIKLKKAVKTFTITPFIQQVKSDLLQEQESYQSFSDHEKMAEIDSFLLDLGFNPYSKNGEDEAKKIKEALLNLPNVDLNKVFYELSQGDFWQEFQDKLNEAFLFIDPTILVNLEDPRFFYKRNVTYKVVEWALRQAQKKFSGVPVLNIATFVIVRVHDMMLEQRHFHHNMLLHYFETIPETKLGMTKEEVDRAISSIYEYRIEVTGFSESQKAASDWLNYGINKFYMSVRAGNTKMRDWVSPLSTLGFQNVKKLNFGFATVTEGGMKKIYHLHHNAHQFSSKPSLAYDYSNTTRVKRNRQLLNLASVALGFISIPDILKGSIESFVKSFYVQQVRYEGALVGYFESTGDVGMMNRIYAQRENYYILK